ncbi:MAG: HDIG domain-containing protein [Bacteroidales bacterium]|nr:HDIG domain-containing protein [Bacteroidales bacterium]
MKLPKKSYWLRAIYFIVAVAAIVYFLPRSRQHEYIYEENRPWSYGLLTAPFDIPVHLDSVSARHVMDSIDARFEPVFTRDTNAEKIIVGEISSRLNSTDTLHLSPTEKNEIISRVRKIYNDGIVPREVYTEIRAGKLPAVRFIHDNISMSMPTAPFLSAIRAYERLDSSFRSPHVHSAIAAIHLAELLEPNVRPDSALTRRLLSDAYLKATAPIGVIQTGERIIDKGEVVTPRLATVLHTYEEMIADRSTEVDASSYYPIVGQTLYVVILFIILYSYFYYFRPQYFSNDSMMLFVMSGITALSLFSFAVDATFRHGIYLVPFTVLPIIAEIFMDSRTALYTFLVQIFICAILPSFALEFIFVQFVAGVVAIDSLNDLARRSQLIRTALLIFLSYCVSYVAIELMTSGSIQNLQPRMLGLFAINGVMVSFCYVLIFIFERIFGFTSRVTLVELSDINNPLLRELSEECPGTFQHSMQVSNLSAEAARRIGANVQLVRAGALYHDIGKIKNPAFYTENQHGVNPHDALDPMQSARVITGHVTEGLKLAEKNKLPQIIRSFISEHHGRGTARYFYTTYCNSHPDETVDKAPFSYPGPNPMSKETSILMMADAVEASSRSLKDYSPEAIQNLVNRIIDTQIAEGLHNDSPISFRDVQEIKDVFVQRLRTMYHTRISYPDLKKNPDETKSTEPQPSAAPVVNKDNQ